MTTDVTLNGESLDPQPSRIVPHPPEPVRVRAANGGYISFVPEFGWTFEVQYGSDQIADADPITDFNSKLSGNDVETLGYTDTAGNSVSKTVIFDSSIAPGIRWGDMTEQFSIMLYVAA